MKYDKATVSVSEFLVFRRVVFQCSEGKIKAEQIALRFACELYIPIVEAEEKIRAIKLSAIDTDHLRHPKQKKDLLDSVDTMAWDPAAFTLRMITDLNLMGYGPGRGHAFAFYIIIQSHVDQLIKQKKNAKEFMDALGIIDTGKGDPDFIDIEKVDLYKLADFLRKSGDQIELGNQTNMASIEGMFVEGPSRVKPLINFCKAMKLDFFDEPIFVKPDLRAQLKEQGIEYDGDIGATLRAITLILDDACISLQVLSDKIRPVAEEMLGGRVPELMREGDYQKAVDLLTRSSMPPAAIKLALREPTGTTP